MSRREEERGATRQLLTGYAASVTLRRALGMGWPSHGLGVDSSRAELYMETPRVEPELTSSRLHLRQHYVAGSRKMASTMEFEGFRVKSLRPKCLGAE
jgi:hypothetical protein